MTVVVQRITNQIAKILAFMVVPVHNSLKPKGTPPPLASVKSSPPGVWGFMTSVANKIRPSAGCCWHRIAAIRAANSPASCRSVGQVDTIATSDIPDAPERDSRGHRGRHQPALRRERATGAQQAAHRSLSRNAAAVRAGRRAASRIDAGLGARRHRHDLAAVRRAGILQRIRAAFPDSDGFDETDRGKALNRGVEAAHAVMVKIFEKLPAGQFP